MRLSPDAGHRHLQGEAQLRLCPTQRTVVVGDVVMLESSDPISPMAPADAPDFTGGFAGLAFDAHCRLFHARPEAGAVDVVLWGRTDALGVHQGQSQDEAHPFALTGSPQVDDGALPQQPLALACDARDFLYLADPPARAIWLVDTWQQEVARRLDLASAPLDLAVLDQAVYALLEDGSTWQLAPCDPPRRTPWPAVPGARRLALGPRVPGLFAGQPIAWVLTQPGSAAARLHALHTPLELPAAGCTDLLVEAASAGTEAGSSSDGPARHHVLIQARRPGEEFGRVRISHPWPGGGAAAAPTALAGLVAPHYDGRGIEAAPDGRVAYWTAQGLRHAAPARGRYREQGLFFSLALDAEQDQASWGRLVVEACLPAGTQLSVWAFTLDEHALGEPIAPPVPDAPPGTPPALPQALWDQAAGRAPQRLFRDPSQRPLAPAAADGFARYDAPIIAPPGRHLWLVFQLEGTRSKSPRLRSARVEFPGHRLLPLLPRTLWREPAARDFLFRYLMPLAAMLEEWDQVAGERHRLLDARIAPGAALGWLARFAGLVLDPCWPEAAQRRLILEAAPLFRTRGTLASLQRMLELLTDAPVVILENFRLRGGGVVGNAQSVLSQAVLGAGYRVGGRIGEPPQPHADPVDDRIAQAEAPDFDDFAHRFTITLVAALDDTQLACARRLVEAHKPAHTDFTLCTAQTGIRAGVGTHVGISSVIGPAGGFQPAIAGDAALGAGFLLGRPALVDSAGDAAGDAEGAAP